MVGLPARGKTFVSHKICSYLNWLGYDAKTFNVGEYRRKSIGPDMSHDFFSSENPAGQEARRLSALLAMNDLISWLEQDSDLCSQGSPVESQGEACRNNFKSSEGKAVLSKELYMKNYSSASPSFSGSETLGSIIYSKIEESKNKVAVFDATNTTKERRRWILQTLLKEGITLRQILFIEIICNDLSVINSNISLVKLSSPDYVNIKDKDEAIQDFKLRIKHYEDSYEPISTDDEFTDILEDLKNASGCSDLSRTDVSGVSVIKIINVNEQMNIMNCYQYWQSRIAYYLMNLRICPRTIYICRVSIRVFYVKEFFLFFILAW